MKRLISILTLALVVVLTGCEGCKEKDQAELKFKDSELLNALLSGEKNLGSTQINDAKIRQLNYQKANNLDRSNGVVLSKLFLTSGINGFTEAGINMPVDTSNYSLWDFLVVYPGLAIEGEATKYEPAIFFYKGGMDSKGDFVPMGNPVSVPEMTGGGGLGANNSPTPPPM